MLGVNLCIIMIALNGPLHLQNILNTSLYGQFIIDTFCNSRCTSVDALDDEDVAFVNEDVAFG
jgi:hypothetical protein